MTIGESHFAKWLIAGGCISSVSCPLLISSVMYILPCMPPFLGSIFLDCPNANVETSKLKMGLLIIAEIYIDLFGYLY
jgi:hypothetical protein